VRPPAGCDLVLTQDTLVAGVHFRERDPPRLIARKALRVNLSDLAAKGGEPLCYLLSLGIAPAMTGAWAEEFVAGLAEDQATYGMTLLGGDTVLCEDRAVITVTVCGTVPSGAMVRRAGARPGDRVYVSGTIGDGALGLRLLRDEAGASFELLAESEREHLRRRYLLPEPRTSLAAALRAHASAAMDVSDGLVGDLSLLLEASGCSARIEAARVPLSPAAARLVPRPELFEAALTGGDDYEILCTVAPREAAALTAAAQAAGVALTEIGEVVQGRGPAVVFGADGAPMSFAQGSYAHF